MASQSPHKEDITKQKTSELLDVTEVSESDCEENCEETVNKRKYISSVSKQDISINSPKRETKKQPKKKPKHEKQEQEKQAKQETESNENKYNISIKGISKQRSEINEKLSNVMMKNDSCLEKK